MAKKRDLNEINNAVSLQIGDITADPATAKPVGRRTYNEEEAAQYIQSGNTSGRKGLHSPRINMAFSPEVYEFIKTMARVRGETITNFVNHIIADSMKEYKEVYEEAQKFRNSL